MFCRAANSRAPGIVRKAVRTTGLGLGACIAGLLADASAVQAQTSDARLYVIAVNSNFFSDKTLICTEPSFRAVPIFLKGLQRLAQRTGYKPENIHYRIFDDVLTEPVREFCKGQKDKRDRVRLNDATSKVAFKKLILENITFDDRGVFEGKPYDEVFRTDPNGHFAQYYRDLSLPRDRTTFSRPEKGEITDAIEEVVGAANGKKDAVIIFISTHGFEDAGPVMALSGYMTPSGTKDFPARAAGVKIPGNAEIRNAQERKLTLKEIVDSFLVTENEQLRVFVFIDACRVPLGVRNIRYPKTLGWEKFKEGFEKNLLKDRVGIYFSSGAERPSRLLPYRARPLRDESGKILKDDADNTVISFEGGAGYFTLALEKLFTEGRHVSGRKLLFGDSFKAQVNEAIRSHEQSEDIKGRKQQPYLLGPSGLTSLSAEPPRDAVLGVAGFWAPVATGPPDGKLFPTHPKLSAFTSTNGRFDPGATRVQWEPLTGLAASPLLNSASSELNWFTSFDPQDATDCGHSPKIGANRPNQWVAGVRLLKKLSKGAKSEREIEEVLNRDGNAGKVSAKFGTSGSADTQVNVFAKFAGEIRHLDHLLIFGIPKVRGDLAGMSMVLINLRDFSWEVIDCTRGLSEPERKVFRRNFSALTRDQQREIFTDQFTENIVRSVNQAITPILAHRIEINEFSADATHMGRNHKTAFKRTLELELRTWGADEIVGEGTRDLQARYETVSDKLIRSNAQKRERLQNLRKFIEDNPNSSGIEFIGRQAVKIEKELQDSEQDRKTPLSHIRPTLLIDGQLTLAAGQIHILPSLKVGHWDEEHAKWRDDILSEDSKSPIPIDRHHMMITKDRPDPSRVVSFRTVENIFRRQGWRSRLRFQSQ